MLCTVHCVRVVWGRYEAGQSMFDLSKILSPTEYEGVEPPPPEAPPELDSLHALVTRTRRRAGGGGAGGRSGSSELRGGVQGIGVPEDELLVVSCGGRFELPPERCAALERRYVALLRRVRSAMADRYDEHVAYESRLSRMCKEHLGVAQHVAKRRALLSVFTEKELKKWFESSGFNSPDFNKTEERQRARKARDEKLARLQLHLQRVHYELELSTAQRCRGWTPQT